ncbi:MAG: IclR family transcriptional regulator [Methylacidiphilales bacterium]|nr:IclR family transcriptional regulator [Candidatus Methylacidiphilales bacterium]
MIDAPGTAPRRRRGAVQTVERALDILDVLGAASNGMRLNDVAGRVGLNVSTCHHLIATLLERGYVCQNPRGRTYFLGTKMLDLSRSRAEMIDVIQSALSALRALNEVTGETVSFDVLRGRDLITLAKLESRHAVHVVLDEVAKAEAAHATGSGKAILAWLPEAELTRILPGRLKRFTEGTVRSREDLMENLLLVQCDGFAIDREEFQPGVVSVGSSIRDRTGAVVGALDCLLPTSRAGEDRIARICGLVRDAATSLSRRLLEPEPAMSFEDAVKACPANM